MLTFSKGSPVALFFISFYFRSLGLGVSQLTVLKHWTYSSTFHFHDARGQALIEQYAPDNTKKKMFIFSNLAALNTSAFVFLDKRYRRDLKSTTPGDFGHRLAIKQSSILRDKSLLFEIFKNL